MKSSVLLFSVLLTTTGIGCTQTPSDAANDATAASHDGGDNIDGASSIDAGSGTIDAGTIDAGIVPLIGLPYPTRGQYRIKGILPDFWPDKDAISGNNAGGVSMNMTWWTWEPNISTPPCNSNQQEYQGRCYKIERQTDDEIRAWTNRGLVVSVKVYGVPAWARVGNPNCSPHPGGFQVFCAPDDPNEFARYAGMIAHRYNGLNGHGRIADFEIHNEVNHNTWFDVGCGSGIPCDLTAWVQEYTANYNAAYDAIKAEQSEAKVLVSFDQHFGSEYDLPNEEYPIVSIQTFLSIFTAGVGDREWMVAYHPYPKNQFAAEFDAKDLPNVTFGNVGALPGYLRAQFPNDPHAWEVMLTEQGIHSGGPLSSEELQAEAICDAYYNVLATPGITNFIYYRMQDHGDVESGLQMGLARNNGSLKPSWAVWAMANRNDLSPPQLSCGFENLPHTVLMRGVSSEHGHWVSSRLLPAGFEPEASGWKLLREKANGTKLLYECAVGGHNLLSLEADCDGNTPMGPVGWIWTTQQTGTVPLYMCTVLSGMDHFASTDANCEGLATGVRLGYVLQ